MARCAPFLGLAPSIQLDGDTGGGRVLHDCLVVVIVVGCWVMESGGVITEIGTNIHVGVFHFSFKKNFFAV